MISIIKFKAEHAEILCPDAVDEAVRNADPAIWQAWAKYNEIAGPAYTGFKDGRMLGSAGIRLGRNKTGHVWLVLRRNILTKSVMADVIRSIRKILKITIDEFDLKALRSESRIGFEQSQRFLEHFGFVRQRRNMIKRPFYFYKLEIM